MHLSFKEVVNMSVRLIATPELCYFICTSMSRVNSCLMTRNIEMLVIHILN